MEMVNPENGPDPVNDSGINTEEPRSEKKESPSSISYSSIWYFFAITVALALVLEIIPNDVLHSVFFGLPKNSNGTSTTAAAQARRKYAIYGKSKTDDHLFHVIQVLTRMGYERTSVDGDWDLLWAHDYPFLTMPKVLKNLEPHQKVNHFPGCGFITNKVDLSTTPLPFLPKAFKLPSDKGAFLEYSNQNPTALFVEKHNEHRFIEIKPAMDINLDSNSSFIQEFVQNPLLVDGYKFDIGVYVVLTSVDPLRVYIYSGDILFRFCPVKYHPFDPKNVDKYVVGDDYLPLWEVPSLSKYYNKFSSSMRGAFDAYVRDQGQNPLPIWSQVEDIVRRTVQSKAKYIADIVKTYKTKNFFDLMRFDMIIDDKLNVILMEANMSPNLSSAHFKPNKLLYEQILYSVLNLVGVGSPVEGTILNSGSPEVSEMVSSEKNIATLLNVCVEYDCDKSCNKVGCELCLPCLSGSQEAALHAAYREHLHRISMKRIIPKPIDDLAKYDIVNETQNMNLKDQWMTRWFYAKCADEITWCH